jgi:hypothetical protein
MVTRKCMQLLRQGRQGHQVSRTQPDSVNIATFCDRKAPGVGNYHDPANASAPGKCNHYYIAGSTTDG